MLNCFLVKKYCQIYQEIWNFKKWTGIFSVALSQYLKILLHNISKTIKAG